MKIATIVGARPQFIKAAAVSRVLRGEAGIGETLIHTGQHHDLNMSEIFFDELSIPRPDHNLGIAGGSHGAQTGRMLEAIEAVLLAERPDWVLVYGDTNSTLAGALAAVKLHIPVAHVEAGLRSFNRRMPEEINRVLTDHAAEILYCPTDIAVANLRREGIPEDRIALVGDVMFDAALFYGEIAAARSRILEEVGVVPGGYVLATIHRAENTDDIGRLESIFRALDQVAEEVSVVMPLHPRTSSALEKAGLAELAARRIRLIEPVGYLDMIMLEKSAKIVATDSGGVQKEAYFYGVPCVTLRDETEWVELVDAGWNQLAPPGNADLLVDRVLRAAAPDTVGERDLYGDGSAALAISRSLLSR